ncbi:glycosyltransferase, partial [Reyranella sp.]|uniref:glycosyltransferase n=1 Tax=Reyranella sp. TaxID=1929291 RepID=UPI0037842CA9
RLQELTADLLEPTLQIARILYARRDSGAVEALLNVLKVDLQNQEALRRLTRLLERREASGTRALALWDKLAGLQRGSVPAILIRARLLELTGRFADAEIEYRRALALDGRHPGALSHFATLLSGQQRWEQAIEVHRERLLIEPGRADILLDIGQGYSQLDRLQDAQACYDRALALEPSNISALSHRGRLLRSLGQVDASIADMRKLCALDPGNTQAWRELIFFLASAEREAEALAALNDAEAALGRTAQTWMALGSAAAAALFEERAITYYERAIAAEPGNPACHAQLGLHYLRQGVPDGAFHHLLDSRDLDPDNVEVAKGLFDTTRLLCELGVDHMALRRRTRTIGEILVPERLFAHVRRVAETKVAPYEPVANRIVAISASLAPGGAERQLVNMLRGLSNPALGLDLALFCISLSSRWRRDFFLPLLDNTGVEIVVPDPRATEDYLWNPEVAPFAGVIRHFPTDMVGPIAFWLLEFRRRRPQVVHAWQDSTNLTAVVAALLAGVPRIVLCCRSVRPDNRWRRLRRFMGEAYRAVLDHPAVVLSNNSRAGANDYAQWLELEPERVEVVYNGIDFDRLDSAVDPEETARARQELGIAPGAPVLGGVYRMSEEKRPLLWLDVAAAVARQNDTVHFVVCGDGPMRDEMRSHATTLGIADRVHLPGARSNIGSWYKMMDVVLLTSRHEGLPNVLLEAQSLGVPVVAPNVGGMSEVIEQGITGWTIRNADAASLAERVLHCLTDLDWRQNAAERAPRFVRDRFGVATMLRRNLEVYGMAHEAR